MLKVFFRFWILYIKSLSLVFYKMRAVIFTLWELNEITNVKHFIQCLWDNKWLISHLVIIIIIAIWIRRNTTQGRELCRGLSNCSSQKFSWKTKVRLVFFLSYYVKSLSPSIHISLVTDIPAWMFMQSSLVYDMWHCIEKGLPLYSSHFHHW